MLYQAVFRENKILTVNKLIGRLSYIGSQLIVIDGMLRTIATTGDDHSRWPVNSKRNLPYLLLQYAANWPERNLSFPVEASDPWKLPAQSTRGQYVKEFGYLARPKETAHPQKFNNMVAA